MKQSSTLDQILQQLETETGISFCVKDSILDEAETVAKIRDMLSFYQTRDNRNLFLCRFLLGQLSAEEIQNNLQHFCIENEVPRILFLLESRQPYDPTVISVLSNLYAAGADMIVEMDTTHIVILRQLKRIPSTETIQQMAFHLIDTLETEAMASFCVSYDNCCSHVYDLPACYQNLHAAMKIGTIFYSSQRIFSYGNLGLGKLLYHLPKEICQNYLKDNFGSLNYKELDDETLHIIHTFFDSGLNIAESARKLYMHRNTLVYRLDKIEKLLGLDIRKFEDAITCKVGMMLETYLISQETT